ncbi:MAG: glycosyltransferase family 2 protein, partial [Candidatus Sericytochromatia bacterium]
MNVIDIIFYEGYKLQSKNEYTLAIHTYKKIFELKNVDLNSNTKTLRNIFFELSVCLFISNNKKESIEYLLKSYILDKYNHQTLLHLIKYYVLSEDLYKSFHYWTELNNNNDIEQLQYIKSLDKTKNIYTENLIELLNYLLSLDGWKNEEKSSMLDKLNELEYKLNKPKISVCMIVKNEENFIEDSLKSVLDIAFEIIVVDTGSKDKTKEIASKYAKVFDYKWNDDFSKARNYSINLAKGDWILLLDADEIMTSETSKNIFSFINQEENNEDNKS